MHIRNGTLTAARLDQILVIFSFVADSTLHRYISKNYFCFI